MFGKGMRKSRPYLNANLGRLLLTNMSVTAT
jgi:hypothetical protein